MEQCAPKRSRDATCIATCGSHHLTHSNLHPPTSCSHRPCFGFKPLPPRPATCSHISNVKKFSWSFDQSEYEKQRWRHPKRNRIIEESELESEKLSQDLRTKKMLPRCSKKRTACSTRHCSSNTSCSNSSSSCSSTSSRTSMLLKSLWGPRTFEKISKTCLKNRFKKLKEAFKKVSESLHWPLPVTSCLESRTVRTALSCLMAACKKDAAFARHLHPRASLPMCAATMDRCRTRRCWTAPSPDS